MNYDISYDDIRTIFTNCMLQYKGELVYSHRSVDDNVLIEYLKDNKLANVKFKFNDFEAVQSRLGYVNFSLGCAYVSRRPIRRYSIGLNAENVKIKYVTGQRESMDIQQRALSFRDRAYVDMFNGEYPNLESAFDMAKEFGSAYAFDRQFAVNKSRHVLYKNGDIVGEYNPRSNKITFYPGFEYLSSLLDGSYGKSA